MSKIQELIETLSKATGQNDQLTSGVKPKAFAYYRVSTQMQDDKDLSIPQQQRDVLAFAERNGIEIVEEYREARSGYVDGNKRTEFNRMVACAKSDPSISLIIVHEYSRFSRNFIETMALLPELNVAGVELVSATEPKIDMGTTSGLFMGAFTHASNEVASRKISEHVKKGCRANIQARDPETGYCYKNGGRPMWGYRAKHSVRGNGVRGRQQYKLLWELDDTTVAGKPLHEWVRHCLIDLVLNGANNTELRDFCNEKGIPGRQEQYWSHHSWKKILTMRNVLQYAGYGIWNSRSRKEEHRPVSEWIIVENAHPPIITEDEAMKILDMRKSMQSPTPTRRNGRTRSSRYLLTGGLFKCAVCGKNLVGHKVARGDYYICGTHKYRKGLGCGESVYVPLELAETEVIKGIEDLMGNILEHTNIVKMVNAELRKTWETKSGYDPCVKKQLKKVEDQIENVRNAILNGLHDAEWANSKLDALIEERDGLQRQLNTTCKHDKPLQVDLSCVRNVLTDLTSVQQQANPEERKRFISGMVESMTLNPDSREVNIRYRLPEFLLESSDPLFVHTGLAVQHGSVNIPKRPEIIVMSRFHLHPREHRMYRQTAGQTP